MQKCLISTVEVLVPKYHQKQEHFQSVFPRFSERNSAEIVFLSPCPQGKWSSPENDLPSWSVFLKNKAALFQVGLG